MANLARPINRTFPARADNGSRTRVLLLRQPIKSVRKEDEPSRAGYRLLLGSMIAVGIVGMTWLLGQLGFRLGFAQMLGLPELLTEPGGGLTTGALIIMSMPLRVVESGVAEPGWLMLAFAFMLAPGGALAGVKPQDRGGPKPSNLTVVGWWTASISAFVAAGCIVAYVVSPFRAAWAAALPESLEGVDVWLSDWSVAAGVDGLVVVAAALWMVLAFRASVPLWMRSMSIVACIFALAVASVAMGMSNATTVHLRGERSLVQFNAAVDAGDGATAAEASEAAPAEHYILLGYTRHHAALMHIDADGSTTLRMFDVPVQFDATGRTSIAEELLAHMPEEF